MVVIYVLMSHPSTIFPILSSYRYSFFVLLNAGYCEATARSLHVFVLSWCSCIVKPSLDSLHLVYRITSDFCFQTLGFRYHWQSVPWPTLTLRNLIRFTTHLTPLTPYYQKKLAGIMEYPREETEVRMFTDFRPSTTEDLVHSSSALV